MSLPDAIDLSHHLSHQARERRISPLKGLQRYYGKPGLISLAGGLPDAEYFPFASLTGEILPCDRFQTERSADLSWFWRLFRRKSEQTNTVSVPKWPQAPGELSLSTALQYSLARGVPQLENFVFDFTAKVHNPPYRNFTTIVHAGNTDGWAKVVSMLCDTGQGILASEWTYTSALATFLPQGIKGVPVALDAQGMRDDALRDLLSNWDESVHGMPRPHVMYIIPAGQNPTGGTLSLERKKAIYDICVEFDVIIVEDDPYYFLQEGVYLPPQDRKNKQKRALETSDDPDIFLSQLSPSFLSIDYQGRVIRLDSFSKTIAPGSRLGWCTCQPLFADRFERQAEISSQAPCGFGQSMLTSLLLNWRSDGYIRWLGGLRTQYIQRRDFFLDCLWEQFDVVPAVPAEGICEGSTYYVGRRKSGNSLKVNEKKEFPDDTPLFSLVPPTSGMFIWIQIHLGHHPLYPSHGSKALETKLWLTLNDAGLLLAPGSLFATASEVQLRSDRGHFRASFSNAKLDDLREAVRIFATVLESFFEDSKTEY